MKTKVGKNYFFPCFEMFSKFSGKPKGQGPQICPGRFVLKALPVVIPVLRELQTVCYIHYTSE